MNEMLSRAVYAYKDKMPNFLTSARAAAGSGAHMNPCDELANYK